MDVLWKRLQCQEGPPEGQHWSPCQTVMLLYCCVKNLTSVFLRPPPLPVIIFFTWEAIVGKATQIQPVHHFKRREITTDPAIQSCQENDLNPAFNFVIYCFPFGSCFICYSSWKLELCIAYLNQQEAGLSGVSVSERLRCDGVWLFCKFFHRNSDWQCV